MTADPHTWTGAAVRGDRDEPLGHIAAMYFHDATGRATWAAVSDGSGSALVPLDNATIDELGVRVPYGARQLVTAPPHDAAHLEPRAERELYRHYGLIGPGSSEPALPGRHHMTTAAHPDGEMVRSEEQLRVGVEVHPYRRVRLVTYIVTEPVTFTVPVSRQEVRLEEIPLTGADSGATVGGEGVDRGSTVGELSADVHAVVLHREEVSFTTRIVPVERVRLVRGIVAGEQRVTTALRAERIDLVHDPVDPDADTPVRGVTAVDSPPPPAGWAR